MSIRVYEVSWESHQTELRQVRNTVFIEEQKVSRDLEWDGMDETSVHFVAKTTDNQAIGTARLMQSGQIGRMAVLIPYRSHGIGRQLLDLAIRSAGQRGIEKVFLHAQSHALGFYLKAGFVEDGPEFEEAGIPHRSMTRFTESR
ncbi:MAG: GNAT family N-acetyltransferase [Pseudomonadales bacterium]